MGSLICFVEWENKLSLKDRLASSDKQQQVKYYKTSEEFHEINSLGVLDELLKDEDINSIYVNGAKNVYVERKGKLQKSNKFFRDNVQLENIIRRNALDIGFELDNLNPYFEFCKEEGIRVCASLPPLSNPASIYVKCYNDKYATIQNLQEELSFSKEIALFLDTLFLKPVNVLITGKKNSLKTTLLSALAKKSPQNNRSVLVDYKQEFQIKQTNFTNYNFSEIKDFDFEKKLLGSIISTSPDNIFLNDINPQTFAFVNQKMLDGYKGIYATLCAQSPKEGMDKIALSILSQNPNLNLETARILAYQTIDFVIHTTCDEQGRRKIASISEVRMDLDSTYSIIDIFSLNPYSIHRSLGIIPQIYKEFKTNIDINQNVFEQDYNHTYVKNISEQPQEIAPRGVNTDILKKFKKDLPTNQDNSEIIKNAQNKFDELRKNAKMHEIIEENEEIQIDSENSL